jgi:hypothetical protein
MRATFNDKGIKTYPNGIKSITDFHPPKNLKSFKYF